MTIPTDQQRIEIAEACGWTEIILLNGCLIGWPPKDRRGYREVIPNYPNDLNAMHEAEKVLKDEQFDEYISWLIVLDTSGGFTATASKRAEAFLRTIGKWKD